MFLAVKTWQEAMLRGDRMKKRHILLTILTFMVFLTCIVPGLWERLSEESRNTAFCVSLRGDKALAHFEEDEYPAVLRAYKESGVSVLTVYEKDLTFDERMISLAEEAGLSVALFLDGAQEKNPEFYDKLYSIAESHPISFIGVRNPEKYTVSVELADFLEKYGSILVLKEKMTQLSNDLYEGYDEAITAANGRIMRCFECWEEPARTISSGGKPVDYADVLVHQMKNSAKDRNTRFVMVNQIISVSDDVYVQMEHTKSAVRAFCTEMESDGYDINALPDYGDYSSQRTLTSAGAAFIGIMMALFMMHIVSKKLSPFFDYIGLAVALGAFAVTFVMPKTIVLLYPTAYSAVGACFSFTVCAFFGRKAAQGRMSTFVYTVYMTGIALGVLILSGLVLLALLGGPDYYLNIIIFRGVKITLMLPIVYAAVMLFLFYSDKSFKENFSALPQTIKNAMAKIRAVHVVLLLAVMAAGVLFLMRSGNSSISIWENKFRNLLSDTLGVRPRTKEFLIGWPCFVLWMYYIRKDSLILKWIFGVGASLLFASATNTFCHVFTDGGISLLRTVNGLIASVPVIVLVSAVNIPVYRLLKRR